MACESEYEYRWHSVYEKLPQQYEKVWFLWKDTPDDVVIGYRTYEPTDRAQAPYDGWYELDNKIRWSHWWHPLSCVEVPREIRDKIKENKNEIMTPEYSAYWAQLEILKEESNGLD